jgi:hypothetical protein
MEKSSTFRQAVETESMYLPFPVPPHRIHEQHATVPRRPRRTTPLLHPLSQLRGSPTKVLAAIDEFSETHAFLISIGAHKAGVLSDFIAKEKPKIVLELEAISDTPPLLSQMPCLARMV